MTSSLNPFPHPLNGGDTSFTQQVFEYILSTAEAGNTKISKWRMGGWWSIGGRERLVNYTQRIRTIT